jgi:hypothetical protein
VPSQYQQHCNTYTLKTRTPADWQQPNYSLSAPQHSSSVWRGSCSTLLQRTTRQPISQSGFYSFHRLCTQMAGHQAGRIAFLKLYTGRKVLCRVRNPVEVRISKWSKLINRSHMEKLLVTHVERLMWSRQGSNPVPFGLWVKRFTN